MKLFIWFLSASLLLELSLYGVAAASVPFHPLAFFPILPAMWIAMLIGGVHSAGFLSFVVGTLVTALAYALVGCSVVRVSSMLWHTRDDISDAESRRHQ